MHACMQAADAAWHRGKAPVWRAPPACFAAYTLLLPLLLLLLPAVAPPHAASMRAAPRPAPVQALLLQFRVALVSATALLVWESVEKYTTPSDDFMRGNALPIANTTLASGCLAVLLGLGGLLLWRVWRGAAAAGWRGVTHGIHWGRCMRPAGSRRCKRWCGTTQPHPLPPPAAASHSVHRAGRAWSPRRKTTVALFGLELAVQALNLTFYLAPNAYVLAQPCSWFLLPVHVFALVRWTCQNTVSYAQHCCTPPAPCAAMGGQHSSSCCSRRPPPPSQQHRSAPAPHLLP